jgi:hypothetical protein
VNQTLFDAMRQAVTRLPSRRNLLRGLAGAGLSLSSLRLPDALEAKSGKQKRARKKKKPKIPRPVFNQFGCLDVGQPCRGDGSLCCSGVCAGKKPTKGKPDRRVCAAHNAGDCSPQRNYCELDNPPVLSLCNLPSDTALCLVTTGSAPFCGSALGFDAAVHCQTCAKDADCVALGFPPGSACVQMGERCNACEATQNRACMAPAIPA